MRMGVRGVRTAMRAVVLCTWPAVLAVKALLHYPPWGTGLSDAGASASLLCCVALMAASRLTLRREGRHARSTDAGAGVLGARISELAARVDRHDDKMGFIFRTMSETNAEAGYPAPDADATMPQRALRLVRSEVRHSEAG